MADVLETLKQGLAGRYNVEGKLGEGGMATVFSAQDVKHKRRVAIKVLRPELAESVGSHRFLQEIDIAARLQHPHILPVYDSGDLTGLLYYVMPLVEGESLKDRLHQKGQLSWKEAEGIVREVASALAYAHREGVVHRDIKPANILLSQGHAVVADFGIARAVSTSGGGGMTQAGMAIGTPWYMSPEQATGEPGVDGRTDIYALGCVLYEMLSGSPPFDGPTAQSIIAKAISAPVPKLESVVKDTPRPIHALLTTALAKDPDQRYPSGEALISALDSVTASASTDGTRRWLVPVLATAVLVLAVALISFRGGGRATSVAAGADVIAVLPFSATGPDVEYLGEGMVDLLSTNLNAVGGIRTVDSRVVINRWKERGGQAGLNVDEAMSLGRDINAGSILTGSVVEAGRTIRFSAELHSVDGDEIGRVQLDGSADSVLQLVDSLSIRLLRAAWRSREPLPSLSVAGITSGSLDAIRAFLKGTRYYRAGAWDSAIVGFQEAVDHDSTFALAYWQLASARGWTVGLGSPASTGPLARAVELSDRLPPRDRALVMAYNHFQRNEIAALDTMRSYVVQYPSDAIGWHMLGDLRFHSQPTLALSFEQQLEPFDRAIALDSSFSPAAVHAVEIAAAMRDRTRHQHYMDRLGTGVSQAAAFELIGQLYFSGQGVSLLDSVPAAREQFNLLLSSAKYSTGSLRNQLVDRMDSVVIGQEPQSGLEIQGQLLLAGQLLGLGRLSESMRKADYFLDNPIEALRPLGAVLKIQTAAAGYTDGRDTTAAFALYDSRPEGVPFAMLLRAQFALLDGDASRARALLGSVQPSELTNQGFQIKIPALYDAAEGWAKILEGDTLTGVNEMRAALEDFGLIFFGPQSGSGILRLNMATAMARYDETHDEGIRRLRYGFYDDPDLRPIAFLNLAEILAERGDDEAAAVAYSDFIELWERADRALQPRVDSARRALESLVSEAGGRGGVRR